MESHRHRKQGGRGGGGFAPQVGGGQFTHCLHSELHCSIVDIVPHLCPLTEGNHVAPPPPPPKSEHLNFYAYESPFKILNLPAISMYLTRTAHAHKCMYNYTHNQLLLFFVMSGKTRTLGNCKWGGDVCSGDTVLQ